MIAFVAELHRSEQLATHAKQCCVSEVPTSKVGIVRSVSVRDLRSEGRLTQIGIEDA